MPELTQEQLDAMVEAAGKAGADAAIKSLPTINAAGVQVIHDEADTPFKSMGEQLFAVKQIRIPDSSHWNPGSFRFLPLAARFKAHGALTH